MDIINFLCTTLLFSILIILISALRLRRRQVIRPAKPLPPSPPSFPVLGHLHHLKKPLHRSLAAISSIYGPVVSLRFGCRPVLLVSSAAAADECFSANDVVFANRPRFVAGKVLGYDYTTLTWASYGDHWRNLRRITTIEIFSTAKIQSFADQRRDEVMSLVTNLVRDSSGKHKIVLKTRLFGLAMNVLMRMIAGKRYCGEDVADCVEAERFREIVEETFAVSGSTNLGDFLPVLRFIGFKGLERRMLKLHEKKDKFFQEIIDEHRSKAEHCSSSSSASSNGTMEEMEGGAGKKKSGIIDVLLSLQRTDPDYYTDEIIKGVIVVLLSAGTDTSTVTLEWAMSLLLNHPDKLAKARAELDNVIGHDRLISESDFPRLPFLSCIIQETLRLHPAGTIIPAHESSDDCTVGGYHVPRGTLLLVSAWAIQRDPELWDDPSCFKPERFADGGPGGDGKGMIAFGMGRRRCPGEGLAMRVVTLALGALIQCFEWSRVGEVEVDMSEGSGLTTPKAVPLEVLCKPRHWTANIINLS